MSMRTFPSVFCHSVMVPALLTVAVTLATAGPQGKHPVSVEIVEGIPAKETWQFERPPAIETFSEAAFGLVAVPKKFDRRGLVTDRTNPYMLVARSRLALPAGEYRLLLRSHGAARLLLDGRLLVEADHLTPNKSSHDRLPKVQRVREPGMHPLPLAHREQMTTLTLDGAEHEFLVEAIVGGRGLRAELGELVVCIGQEGQALRLLGMPPAVPFTEEGWHSYAQEALARRQKLDDAARRVAEAEEVKYWQMRHELARRQLSRQPAPSPPRVSKQTPVHNAIDAYIGHRLEQRGVAPVPLVDDYSFLRRVHLDTVGVVPHPAEIQAFLQLSPDDRRNRTIDGLLEDPGWADHWVGYWQDVLAENPALLKPKLNNTGPFRWWIRQSFADNKPMDRFVTELITMQGSKYGGGPAGFAMATMNDVPMAAKAHVIAKAFLGIDMQCARCHDAPYHPYTQQQLFSLGAMLAKAPLVVPKTSTIDLVGRTRIPAVEITLDAGSAVDPAWPFPDLAPAQSSPDAVRDRDDTRQRLAATLTSAHNDRFAQTIVNRLWKRYLGWGIVEPVDDWSDANPSHAELLHYLAHQLATHDYDLKHVARLILNSHTYQRAIRPGGLRYQTPEDRLFASPARRRMSAEQIVDSLLLVAGKEFRTELLCLDPEGRRPVSQFLNLGTPERAWEFTSLSNDRDRPSLALPFAQNSVDLLVAFGWRESRQNPISVRDQTPTVLQPMVLANGILGQRVTTLSDDGALTDLCLQTISLPQLVDSVFLRLLSRPPSHDEAAIFVELLQDGYEHRRVMEAEKIMPGPVPVTAVSWANHFDPEAVRLKLELAQQARAGDPPTKRIERDWRERMEDMVWSLVQSPEFLFIP